MHIRVNNMREEYFMVGKKLEDIMEEKRSWSDSEQKFQGF